MDTGPWVALIDRSESKHQECVQWLKDYHGDLYTTEAVLTEVIYLLSFSNLAQQAALDFVLKRIITLIPSDIKSLRRVKFLMTKYADLPMDYADATIVCLAEETGISSVVSLDKKHFSIYRLQRNRKFTIIP